MFILWLLALNVGSGYGFFHFDMNRLLKIDAVERAGTSISTLWIDQPLDHFNSTDTRSWKMRYFENLERFNPGGPIVLLLGGEAEANPAWIQYGRLFNFAYEVEGALYMTEHRFYGESVPNQDFSVENLAYLSSMQALADVKNLIDFLKSQSKFINSKVVVFGGSYAGNLAAWLKLVYPESVDAVWSSSAPVLAKTDFYEYLEVVGDGLKKFGTPDCYDKVVKKFQRYEELLKTTQGIEQLKKEEHICDSVDMTVRENQQLFFSSTIDGYMELVQYGTPDKIHSHCSGERLRLENIYTTGYNLWNVDAKCFTCDLKKAIESLKYDTQSKPWIYQICTEFGYMQSTSSVKQPFTQNVPMDFFYKICKGVFGPEFDKDRMEKGVNSTNERYGGLKPDVKYVVFLNGDMDPWHKLGVLEDLSTEVPARVIANGSHCLDLLTDNAMTYFAKSKVKEWIGE